VRTWILRIVAINLVVSAVWFGGPFLKSSQTQALDQHERLVALVAHRNWKQTLALMAVDYHDAWDMNREEAVSLGHEVLQGFLMLDLAWKPTSVAQEGKTATITGFIKASGTGAGFSQEVVSRLNNLREPFVFTWRKDGWKPDDWRLVSVKQTELAGGQP
jgi:hypothetical protein